MLFGQFLNSTHLIWPRLSPVYTNRERICQLNAASVGQPTTTITLAMPVNLLKQVEETAELEGSDVTTIINCLVQEGLNGFFVVPVPARM